MNNSVQGIVIKLFKLNNLKVKKIYNTSNSYNSKVFKVVGDKEYIIKFHKNEVKRKCESKYIEYLSNYVNAPKIIVSAAYENYQYIIMTFLEGKNYSDEEALLLNNKQLFDIGILLANIHNSPIIDEDNDSWVQYLYSCLDMVDKELYKLFGEKNEYIQNYLKDNIKKLIEGNFSNTITHMDFRIGNLLISDEKISVIDLESMKNGDYVFDFVKIHRLLPKDKFLILLNGFYSKFKKDSLFDAKLHFYNLFDSYTSLYWCITNNQTSGKFYDTNYNIVNNFLRGKK